MNKAKRIKISVDKEDVQNIIDCYEKDIEYIKKLENNWNELKEWLEEVQQEEFDINGFTGVCTEIRINCILDKMQEIESRK